MVPITTSDSFANSLFAFVGPVRTLPRKRLAKVIRIRRKQFKVLNPIVLLVPVAMVNNLLGIQQSSKVGLHHKAMLKHVSAMLATVRVILAPNKNIAIPVDVTAAFPVRMIWTRSRSTPL